MKVTNARLNVDALNSEIRVFGDLLVNEKTLCEGELLISVKDTNCELMGQIFNSVHLFKDVKTAIEMLSLPNTPVWLNEPKMFNYIINILHFSNPSFEAGYPSYDLI